MQRNTVISKRSRKKLAVIGASYLQLPLVRKAKELGLEVHCFAWEDGAVCKPEADGFYPLSVVEKRRILEECRRIGIDGICTIASDVAAPTVAFVAESMGLPGNSYESALRANNKFRMRNAFRQAGVPCPQYRMIHTVEESDGMENFPFIVKPSDRSGSKGVSLVHNREELRKAVAEAVSASFQGEVMVEEYVEGREISVEFISCRGKHYPLQITDKVTTGAPHFVELEHHQPAQLTAGECKDIYAVTVRALDALGITDGASHTEFKLTAKGPVIIETGGRMGGDFIGSDLVQLSTGYDFLKGVIEMALGEFEEPHQTLETCSGVYFLCEERKALWSVFDHLEDYPQIVRAEITDPVLKPISCSADRSGYLIYQDKQKLIL